MYVREAFEARNANRTGFFHYAPLFMSYAQHIYVDGAEAAQGPTAQLYVFEPWVVSLEICDVFDVFISPAR